MSNNIQQILDELYQVDSGLRAHEDKLKVILTELLAAHPNIELNEQFRSMLRSQLLAKASELKSLSASAAPKASAWSFFSRPHAWRYAAGSALVLLLAIVASNRGGPVQISSDGDIVSVGTHAFGSLAQRTNSEAADGFGGRGGGGTGNAIVATAPSMPMGVGEDSVSSKMIAPYPPIPFDAYVYTYKGEDFELPATVDVLRRAPGAFSGAAGSFLKNYGVIDLSTFGQARLQNVTLVEDKPFGYLISIFFDEGTISINENWAKWSHPEANCRDEACYQSLRLKASDIPADEKVIAVADQFLAQHKISKDTYGAPEAVNDWRRAYEQSADTLSFYIPDTVTIVYPLVINGQNVYEDGGSQKHGLYVSVNVREMKVSSVGTITSQKYQSSSYAGVTDKKTVLDVVQRGGRYGYIDPQANRVELEVGTPTRAYMKTWNYKDNTSNELLVPALVFPVLKAPTGIQWYPSQIVVPLAKELLEQNDGGPIRIMEGSVPPAKAF